MRHRYSGIQEEQFGDNWCLGQQQSTQRPTATSETTGYLSRSLVLQQKDTTPHSAPRMQGLLHLAHWQILDHPDYYPDLDPADCHLHVPPKQ